MLVTWVSSQPFAHSARSSLAHVGKTNKYTDKCDVDKKALSYSPWDGTYFFLHQGRLFWLRSAEQNVGYHKEEILSISCLGRSPEPLRALLGHCRTEHLKVIQNKTTVFEVRNNRWRPAKARNIRPISTVIMNEEQKTAVLKDIANYLDKQSQAWYSNRGIPYRKGYLLYGPPGTGKSSLSLSIAGHFGLDIYVLDISSITGEYLGVLLADLPARCILLLEDVDAAEATKSREINTRRTDRSPRSSRSKEGLSLSELLNALDGVSSQEGRVLIMTTNHMEHLDPALIRPGRADIKVLLPDANRDIMTRIFCKVFKQLDGDILEPGEESLDSKVIEGLASDFADKIPEYAFSPAEIQSFLVDNRNSPFLSAKNVDDWMVRARKERGNSMQRGIATPHEVRESSEPDIPMRAPFAATCTIDEAVEVSQRINNEMIEISATSGNTSAHESTDIMSSPDQQAWCAIPLPTAPLQITNAEDESRPTKFAEIVHPATPLSSSRSVAAQGNSGEPPGNLLRAAVLDNPADGIDDPWQRHMVGGEPLGDLPRVAVLHNPADGSSDEERLITKDKAKLAICDLLGEQNVSRMLGPKPLWAQFDDPDPDPSMALHLQKMLLKAIENLPIARFGMFTPPASEATDLSSESSEF